MANTKQVKITLVKSLNGRLKNHKATAACLGLSKINQTVVRENNDVVRGMINTIQYLVNVEEA